VQGVRTMLPSQTDVIAREGERSSTARLFDSITGASGILVSRVRGPMIWEANACHSCRCVKTLEHSGLVIVKLAGLVPVWPAHRHDELRDLLGRLQRQGVFAGENGGAHAGA